MKQPLNDPLVHIVIPLYNEEKVLARSVETLADFLKQSGFPYRHVITLANNASTDSSAKIAQELSERFSNVRALNLDKKGKGHAIRTAWSRGEGDILAFMDMDLASDLRFFHPLVESVASEGYDMAVGNRLGKSSVITDRRYYRELISRFYNFLVRLFLRTGIDDHQCGFKAVRANVFREIAPGLQEDGYSIDTELIALSKRRGFRIKAVDIVWNDSRDSKVSVLGDSIDMFVNILRLRKRLARIPRSD